MTKPGVGSEEEGRVEGGSEEEEEEEEEEDEEENDGGLGRVFQVDEA